MSSLIDISKPLAIVTFYTEDQELVARGTKDPKYSMDNDVISINTVRDMGADAPTFTVNLTRHKKWDEWITSNDLVIIEMQRPPEAKSAIFFGLVDDIRKNVMVSDNEVQRVVTITGRGVSKAFIEWEMGYVPESEVVDSSIGWIQNHHVQLAGSSGASILGEVWDNIAKNYVDYKWGKKGNLFKVAKKKLSFRPNVFLQNDMSMINYSGSMWAFFKKIADAPFNELFWEIEDGHPTLILRPTPFNKKDWNKLTLHVLEDKDVVNDSIGRSDLETYTLYSVGVDTLFSSNDIFKTLGIQPIWYKPYAKKYGLQRLNVTSLYAAVSEKSDGPTTVTVVKSMQTDLYNWNIKNNDYYNGVLVVKGDNKYRVGERLKYQSDETGDTKEFYITSVNHQFENFGTWVTILGITRGIVPSDRFTSPVGKSEAYSGLGLAEYDPKAALAVMEGKDITVYSSPSSIDLGKADAVIKVAKGLIGQVEYVFGGPGIPVGMADCSQFTQWCYEKGANLEIGRTTGTQVRKGERVSYQDALPGDIIFFKNTYQNSYIYGVSHVGIYLGDDNMIHNSGGYGVHITTGVMNNSYWKPHFLMCRRVLKENTVSGPVMSMIATAYGASALNVDGGDGYVATGKTATGTTPKEGRTIAVDPMIIPLHSKVKIECSAHPEVNGIYIAEDTGSAIKGNRIDIYFNDLPPADPYMARARMLKFGRQHVKVTILS